VGADAGDGEGGAKRTFGEFDLKLLSANLALMGLGVSIDVSWPDGSSPTDELGWGADALRPPN
jgi:hypothetical protein